MCGAAGYRAVSPLDAGGAARAACGAVCSVVEVRDCEVDREVGKGRVDLESGSGLEGCATVGVGALLGGCEEGKCGDDGECRAEEMHLEG